MDQAEELWLANDMLESINLMKGLLEYLRGVKFQEHQVLAQVHTNLAVSYYKIGFLEEANEEFSSALSMYVCCYPGLNKAPSACGPQIRPKNPSCSWASRRRS